MKKLLLVDGHSLIHRAYHAYPRTLATAKGELTNAIYGFTNILLTAINELAPTHAAVAFDLPKPTFREQMFVGYKQSRVKPDDDMLVQIPRIKEIVLGLNIPIYEVAGFEADDVIGTLAKQAYQKTMSKKQKTMNTEVVILTSDRDLMQLIRGDRVVIKLPPRGSKAKGQGPKDEGNTDIWNEDRFVSEWEFAPRLLPDYKALAGAPSDDIPGVRGIGEKTAKELVSKYGEIADIYRGLLKGRTLPRQGPTLIKKLAEGQEDAQLSKKLATIDTAVPIKLDWKATEIHEYDKNKILKLFDELQFKSLIRKLPNDSFEQAVQEVLF